MASYAKKFRDSFQVSKEIINWYPGHMKNSFVHMQAKMRLVDCVVEVHDSRIPFSGRNPQFVKNLLGSKPHILVLSKLDLMDPSLCKKIREKYKERGESNVIFTNCLNQKCKGLKSIVPLALDLIKESSLELKNEVKYKLLVVGIPNVGKSSLINALRNVNLHKKKATAVGAQPGVTRSVQTEIKVNGDPPIYLIDTPGILLPNITDSECGMKLALCASLKDDLVGATLIADFLLYWMNKTNNFKYVQYFSIKEPTDAVLPLLVKIATSFNKIKKVKNVSNNSILSVPDINFAANYMIKVFRSGKFGDLNLDGC